MTDDPVRLKVRSSETGTSIDLRSMSRCYKDGSQARCTCHDSLQSCYHKSSVQTRRADHPKVVRGSHKMRLPCNVESASVRTQSTETCYIHVLGLVSPTFAMKMHQVTRRSSEIQLKGKRTLSEARNEGLVTRHRRRFHHGYVKHDSTEGDATIKNLTYIRTDTRPCPCYQN